MPEEHLSTSAGQPHSALTLLSPFAEARTPCCVAGGLVSLCESVLPSVSNPALLSAGMGTVECTARPQHGVGMKQLFNLFFFKQNTSIFLPYFLIFI